MSGSATEKSVAAQQIPVVVSQRPWRAQFIRWMLVGILIIGFVTAAPHVLTGVGFPVAALVLGVSVLIALLIVVRASQQIQLLAFLLLLYMTGIIGLIGSAGLGLSVCYFLALIFFAALLWSPIAGGIVMVASLISWGVAAVTMHSSSGLVSSNVWFASAGIILVIGLAMIEGLRRIRGESNSVPQKVEGASKISDPEREALEQQINTRTSQLRAVIDVGNAASAILDPQQLIEQVVNLISERFGYYYAAIFLLNEAGDQAVLHSATGEAGRRLKENKHQLRVGGNSMVGSAISTRQPRIALDTGVEPVRFDNPLLPYTRSEIALPLIVGNQVLGALDVQSTKAGAFGQSEVDTLQGMANQVAIAFENARLFQDSKRSYEELQAVQRQYVQSSWKPLMDVGGLEYKIGDADLPPDTPRMEIPLSLRDETIGSIDLESEADWTPEQRNLVEAIATQAALALEHARLVEASQFSARREHTLAEITSKVWASTSIEGVLRTAVGELGRALVADQARIELGMDESNA